MPGATKSQVSRKKTATTETINESVTPTYHQTPSFLNIFVSSLLLFVTSVQFSIILGAILISFSILASGGLIKNGTLVGGSANITTPQIQNTIPSASDGPDPDLLPGKIGIDDDPIFGDKSATLTMIEFSDYECPYCKRYFEETYPDLKTDYIDTGKIRLVFRDLPLSFHENAPKQAEAANCAREQGGDASYFKYHDEVFTRTTSNGTGLALDQLPVIAGELGLDIDEFKTCLDSGKYASEVTKDVSDASSVSATGTPTFFIMKGSITEVSWDKVVADPSSPKSIYHLFDGEREVGVKIVGAQPLSTFKSQIDKQL